ncbi:MAG: DUF92 domain-containing protein [Acidobacteriota bacterium]
MSSRRIRSRQAIHVSCVLFALLLRFLDWKLAMVMALGALAFNVVVLPQLSLHKEGEDESKHSFGTLLYPSVIALLTLIFRDRLELVALAWGVMAFGDGMASVVGRSTGEHRLPWNAAKSWEGVLAHLVFGGIAGSFLHAWTLGLVLTPGELWAHPFSLLLGFGAATFTALLESLDSGIDDNMLVPIGSALAAWCLERVLTAPDLFADLVTHGRVAFLICLGAGVAAVAASSLTLAGAVTAVVVGTLVAAGAGWSGFGLLMAFFVVGTGVTRLGKKIKIERGLYEARGGRRGMGNVLANGGLAALLALLALATSSMEESALFVLMLAAGLATATFDTCSSEIGQAWGRRTFSPLTGKSVPPGTEGAVSLEGTLAGLVGAIGIGVLGWAVTAYPPAGIAAVVFGGVVGSTFESVLGDVAARRQLELDNDLVNFLNTLVGALAAAWFYL